MQSDGNLVIYNSVGNPIWASGTDGGGFRGQLCGWAVPTLELPSTPHWADHTFATYEKNNRIWGCASGSGGYNPDNPGTRLIARRGGSRNKATCLGRNNSSIIWAVTGFCHQCTNRVLYPAGITVSRARGYTASTALFGTYGGAILDWELLKSSCYGISLPFLFKDYQSPFSETSLPGSVIAQDRVNAMELEHIKAVETETNNYLTEKERQYNAKIVQLYDKNDKNFTQTMGSDLEILLEFKLDKKCEDSSLSYLQNVQYELQKLIQRCYGAFKSQELGIHEFHSYSQDMFKTFFQTFEKTLGEADYEKMFILSPNELSKIPMPKKNNENCC